MGRRTGVRGLVLGIGRKIKYEKEVDALKSVDIISGEKMRVAR